MVFIGETLNMITTFAFIMALGIVVDDAIVVGENIHAHRQMGKSLGRAALDGAVEVAPSVLTSVSTTIVAFMPMLFVSGIMGKIVAAIPMVMIAMLVVSLVESVTILPCHLSHERSAIFTLMDWILYAFRWVLWPLHVVNRWASAGLERFVERIYLPALQVVLRFRSVFVAGCIGLLIVSVGLIRAVRHLSEDGQQQPPGVGDLSRRHARRGYRTLGPASRRRRLAGC